MDEQASTLGSPLLRWASGEPDWIKHLVRDVLDGTTTGANQRVEHYVDLFRRANGLSADSMPPPPELAEPAPVVTTPSERIVLDSIEINGGVNQLKPGGRIEFGTALTVIFGENGCGKSGFVRVLKRAAGARTNTPILGDIRKSSDVSPSATFVYRRKKLKAEKEGQEEAVPLPWNNELAVDPLTQVAVFDTPASSVHVDDDLAYTYTPGALSYYVVIRDVLEGVKAQLTAESSVSLDPLAYRKHFTSGSPVYPLAAQVGPTTDVERLRTFAQVSAEDQQRVAALESEASALKASSPDAELRLAESRLRTISDALVALDAAANLDVAVYNSRVEAYVEAAKAEGQASTSAFEGMTIPGLDTPEWQAFIEAGYTFERAIEVHGHKPDQACAYCQQSLSEPARLLLSKYRDYCSGVARRQRQAAEANLNEFTKALTAAPVLDALAAVQAETGLGAGLSWIPIATGLERAVSDREFIARTELMPLAVDRASILGQAISLAQSEQERLTALIASLRDARSDRTTRLARLESALIELKDRVTLRDLLPSIEKQVEEGKRVSTLQGAVRAIAVSQRQLTEASTEHSNYLVNQDFETAFRKECASLKAPTTVELEFPGREGRSKRKKVVARGIKPSDVLSEGEQKAVAMADFLAEASLSGANGPLVFDDPVNSLDYRRLEVVAGVLHRVSLSRQVVVFTHNVWFASELLNVKGPVKAGTRYWDVSRTDSETGIVTPASHPHIDSYSNLKKRLNTTIEAAKKQTGDEQLESVKKGYGLLRSMTEVVAEKDLFKGVSQRYQAHVAMTLLAEIKVDDLQAAIDQLYPVYEQACRFLDGHSQPMEQSNIQPTLEALQKDFEIVEGVHSSHAA